MAYFEHWEPWSIFLSTTTEPTELCQLPSILRVGSRLKMDIEFLAVRLLWSSQCHRVASMSLGLTGFMDSRSFAMCMVPALSRQERLPSELGQQVIFTNEAGGFRISRGFGWLGPSLGDTFEGCAYAHIHIRCICMQTCNMCIYMYMYMHVLRSLYLMKGYKFEFKVCVYRCVPLYIYI